MFNVSICEYIQELNVFIVCIRNTAVFKLKPLMCTHVNSYMFSTVHPPSWLPISPMYWMPRTSGKNKQKKNKEVPFW